MKISVPIAISSFRQNEELLYYEIKRSRAERVFICCFHRFFEEKEAIENDLVLFRHVMARLKETGLEVGIWVDSLGHGELAHEPPLTQPKNLTLVRGMQGFRQKAFCPMDKNFLRMYREYVTLLADCHPDIIMFDDDLRYGMRAFGAVGCACPLHLKAFYQKTGRKYSRAKITRLVFGGQENVIRKTWIDMQEKSLCDFAFAVRSWVDAVDPNIRLGACTTPDTWDVEGNCLSVARCFAGNTTPFLRTSGAAYWARHEHLLSAPIEYSRMEAAWARNSGVEIFSEDDAYPRPRYVVPSSWVENYDLALLADGNHNGVLKYMFDYVNDPDYERGYVDYHVHNLPLRQSVTDMYRNKYSVGVYVYEEMRKSLYADYTTDNSDLSYLFPKKSANKTKEFFLGVARKIERVFNGREMVSDFARNTFSTRAAKLFSVNSIPTGYTKDTVGPLAVFGNNAQSVPLEELQRGVICDAKAAYFLKERGVDIGLIGYRRTLYTKEIFGERVLERCVGNRACQLHCVDTAVPLSYYDSNDKVASYAYTNADGQRFFVFGWDAEAEKINDPIDFLCNYYRQEQLYRAYEYVFGAPLPVICPKHPHLYLLTKKGVDGSLTVGVFNLSMDPVLNPTFRLNTSYQKASFIHCLGNVSGNTVSLATDIPAYGFAFFEVTDY